MNVIYKVNFLLSDYFLFENSTIFLLKKKFLFRSFVCMYVDVDGCTKMCVCAFVHKGECKSKEKEIFFQLIVKQTFVQKVLFSFIRFCRWKKNKRHAHTHMRMYVCMYIKIRMAVSVWMYFYVYTYVANICISPAYDRIKF